MKIFQNFIKNFTFFIIKKKIMTYIMVKKTSFRFPTERYLNVIKEGYKNCNLDTYYLKKSLNEKK